MAARRSRARVWVELVLIAPVTAVAGGATIVRLHWHLFGVTLLVAAGLIAASGVASLRRGAGG